MTFAIFSSTLRGRFYEQPFARHCLRQAVWWLLLISCCLAPYTWEVRDPWGLCFVLVLVCFFDWPHLVSTQCCTTWVLMYLLLITWRIWLFIYTVILFPHTPARDCVAWVRACSSAWSSVAASFGLPEADFSCSCMVIVYPQFLLCLD